MSAAGSKLWKDSEFAVRMRRDDAAYYVRLGVLWLDVNRPGSVERLDANVLDLDVPHVCPLGQVYGSVWLAPMSVDTAWWCGFIADPTPLTKPHPARAPFGSDLPYLTEAWRAAIIRRRCRCRRSTPHPTTADRYADLDDRHLAAHAAFEDELENLGELPDDDRVTCYEHRSWVWDCGLSLMHANKVTGHNWCRGCDQAMAECEHRGDLIQELNELRTGARS